MNCADSNWLTALYVAPGDAEAKARRATVDRFMRRQTQPLLVSRLVWWETRNVFSRVTGQKQPAEWQALAGDVGTKLLFPELNEAKLEERAFALMARYSRKATLGTFDIFIIATALLADGERVLSFDGLARALASAEDLDVFPELTAAEKSLRSRLKRA